MSRLMNAIGGISDEHIKEFAFEKIPQRTIPVWVKFGSLAAGFVLIALTITPVVGKRNQPSPVTSSENRSEYNSGEPSYSQNESSDNGSINDLNESSYPQIDNSENKTESDLNKSSYPQIVCSADSSIVDSSISSESQTTIIPKVILNDITYILAPDDYPTYDLPEGYVFVGQVTSNDKIDESANGYLSGCHVGDKIYQNPADPQDVFVSTTLFSGGDKYWYIRFVDRGARK